jgi:hypothetical protein
MANDVQRDDTSLKRHLLQFEHHEIDIHFARKSLWPENKENPARGGTGLSG